MTHDRFALGDYDLITSDNNPIVKQVRGLLTSNRQRRKQHKTVLEGVHLLEALFAYNNQTSSQYHVTVQRILLAKSNVSHVDVRKLFALLDVQNTTCDITVLDDALYRSVRSLGDGVDIMAVIDTPMLDLGERIIVDDCLILNDVQDVGNVGTLLRSAACVGVKTIICTTRTANVWSPKALRAGMGAQFGLHIFENVDINHLFECVKVPLLATSSHASKLIYDHHLSSPVAWVMGNEGQGVSDDLIQRSLCVALPQPNGQESLNVAVAGSLCMYEMLRQRMYGQ